MEARINNDEPEQSHSYPEEDKKDNEDHVSNKNNMEEVIEVIKGCVKESNNKLLDLIKDEVIVIDEEKVVKLKDALDVLRPLCQSKVESDNDIEEALKQLKIINNDYVLLKDLLEFFGEVYLENYHTPEDSMKDEEEKGVDDEHESSYKENKSKSSSKSKEEQNSKENTIEVIKGDSDVKEGDRFLMEGVKVIIPEESLSAIKKLAKYLKEQNKGVYELIESIQELVTDEEDAKINVIRADKFYSTLKELNIIEEEPGSLTEFLWIDEDNASLLSPNKIAKLVEHCSKDM